MVLASKKLREPLIPVSFIWRTSVIFCLLILLSSNWLLGQGFQAPPGETIVGKDVRYDNAGSDARVVATDKSIYLSGYHNYAWSPDDKIWTAPPGTSIIDLKISKIYSTSGGTIAYNVLLNNGKYVSMGIKIELAFIKDFYTRVDLPIVYDLPSPDVSANYEKIIGDAVYVLSNSGIYVSRDTAKSWQFDTTGLASAHVWDIALDSMQYVYSATSNGLFIQHPDSNTWRKVIAFTFTNNLYRVFVDRKNRIYIGANGPGIYMSTDEGTTWSVDTTGIENQSASVFGDDAFGNIYLATNGATNGLYKSAEGNTPWSKIDQGIKEITLNSPSIRSVGGDSIIVAATSFGLFSSSDQGATWSESNSSIAAENIRGFLKSQNGKLFTSTSLGVYERNSSDTSWSKVYPANGYASDIAFYADGLGNVYVVNGTTPKGGPIVYETTDAGSSWIPDTSGLFILRTGFYFVDEIGGQHLATTQYGSSVPTLIYSKSLGGSWSLDTSGFVSTSYSFSFSFASDKHGYLYITGYYYNGSTQVNARVMRRSIAGGVWEPDTIGLPASVSYLSKLAPDQNGNMMGISGNSLYILSNGIWGKVVLPNQAVSNFYSVDKFSVDSSGAIFASFTNANGGRGIYFTTNGGSSWTFAGLDSFNITQLVSYGDSTYVSTHNGLYILTRQASGSTEVLHAHAFPTDYALYQNFPNPFNPSTTIRYTLASSSRVSMKIYNILGQQIAELLNSEQAAGRHEKVWNAKAASGLYFYRIDAVSTSDPNQHFTQIKKMMLLK